MGYLGASLTDSGTGYLIENFGWNVGFYVWIFWAIFCSGNLFIWNYKGREVEYDEIIGGVVKPPKPHKGKVN